jgi:hypothetical protein
MVDGSPTLPSSTLLPGSSLQLGDKAQFKSPSSALMIRSGHHAHLELTHASHLWVGTHALITAGDFCHVLAGDYAHIKGGSYNSIHAGDYAKLQVGACAQLTLGDNAHVRAGEQSRIIVGKNSRLQLGAASWALMAESGEISAEHNCHISLRWWHAQTQKWCISSAVIGDGALHAGVRYRFDPVCGEFIHCPPKRLHTHKLRHAPTPN